MKPKAFFKKIKIYYEAILIKTLRYWHKDKQVNGRDQKMHKQTNTYMSRVPMQWKASVQQCCLNRKVILEKK